MAGVDLPAPNQHIIDGPGRAEVRTRRGGGLPPAQPSAVSPGLQRQGDVIRLRGEIAAVVQHVEGVPSDA